MALLGVRGANPIWAEFDLSGKIFDDSFYMYVLQNTIPYNPATVYHDPNLNTHWTNPIQFLGNGTLPNDIYFETGAVYRLEFRQNDGISMPTQDDPLIYEVNNYIAGPGGGVIPDTGSSSPSNQITNPQFALINFGTPTSPTYTFTGTNPDPINVAPGWQLVLAGTGTVTLTKVALSDDNENPSNAPYALQINMSGWSTNSVYLSQRFEQNGMLWASHTPDIKFVSSSITARLVGAPQEISAALYDSTNALLTTVLNPISVDQKWNEFPDVGKMPETNNPNVPPDAYIEYRLALPSNIDIYISSIQLVVQDIPVAPNFEQDSINRQIDHTYNTAYPIVPVGTVIDYGGFIGGNNTIPLHYLPCDGSAVSRLTYNLLFQTLTTTETVTLTATSAIFTVVSGATYRIGMGLENAAIPANTTIIGISTNTITMSSPATVTGSTSVRFFATGRANQETVTLTNTVSTFTLATAANYAIGMAITGNGIQAATIISNIVGTTVTISLPATITGSSLISIYSAGNGNGTTTFNIYDLRDYVVAGSGGSLFGAGLNGIGERGGNATHAITINEMPAHNHPTSTVALGPISSAPTGGPGSVVGSGPTNLNIASQGGGVAMSLVQQTALLYKLIRFE